MHLRGAVASDAPCTHAFVMYLTWLPHISPVSSNSNFPWYPEHGLTCLHVPAYLHMSSAILHARTALQVLLYSFLVYLLSSSYFRPGMCSDSSCVLNFLPPKPLLYLSMSPESRYLSISPPPLQYLPGFTQPGSLQICPLELPLRPPSDLTYAYHLSRTQSAPITQL